MLVELYTESMPDWDDWASIEYRPCRNVPGMVDTVEEADRETAEFWSVYVRTLDGPAYCVADCVTEEDAEALVEKLRWLKWM